MKSFTITLTNNTEPGLRFNESIERLTFPEAVARAYSIRHKLGYDWRIIDVKENIRHTSSSDCTTSGAISIS
jgi:hypothetical protein